MDLRRVRRWEWMAGSAAVALIAVMFVDWYGGGRAKVDAWHAFSAIDVFMLLAALAGIALIVAAATQRTQAIPQAVAQVAVPLALLALVLVVYRLVRPPYDGATREIGAWLGLAVTLALYWSAWRSMRDTSTPGPAAPALEVTPLPPPSPEA